MDRRPLTVFIADDARPVADMLTELIAEPGRIEIVSIGATEEAVIESIRRMKPDAVVLDLQLANGSGTSVIRAVRESPELASTRLTPYRGASMQTWPSTTVAG